MGVAVWDEGGKKGVCGGGGRVCVWRGRDEGVCVSVW